MKIQQDFIDGPYKIYIVVPILFHFICVDLRKQVRAAPSCDKMEHSTRHVLDFEA